MSSAIADNRLDIIIFGATGFTGRKTVEESFRLLSNLKWGIAGRNQVKLLNCIENIASKLGKVDKDIPIFIADIENPTSIDAMVKATKLIINCVGPYRLYGEMVVRACINAGTHHVDVTVEPEFMERMQLEYHDVAKEKGVYVVTACGFESIPSEMGLVYFEKQFDGTVNAVDVYLSVWLNGYRGGSVIFNGTWTSVIYAFGYAEEIKTIREKILKNNFKSLEPKPADRHFLHRANNSWNIPQPTIGGDDAVMRRSQNYFFENYKKRPIQLRAYFSMHAVFLIPVAIYNFLIIFLSKFEPIRNCLIKHPKLFSFGVIGTVDLSERNVEALHFRTILSGTGWPKNVSTTTEPTKRLKIEVTSSRSCYGTTFVSVLLAAKTILREQAKMPDRGGVLTSAVAFSKTTLLDELSKNGCTFKVIEK